MCGIEIEDYIDITTLKEIASSPAVTNIYGNKVAIIIWTDEPEAVVIENEAVAKGSSATS